MGLLKKLFALLFNDKIENEVDYLYAKGNILPEKPTAEEEVDLIDRLSNGEMEARQKLIEKNLRLVVYTAGKFENTGINTDDLVSIGTIGLIKAVNSYKKEKEIKLATYASRCIENEILMQIRKSSKRKGEVSLDDPLNMDSDGNELLLADVLGTDSELVSENVMSEVESNLLRSALSSLCSREQEIMNKRYGLSGKEEMTQKEVADELDISQSYISRLEKKILSKLSRELEKLA
ncbi:MAG: RNA polymerase sporulation sigma factor SigK [Clostridia bacterium]